MDKDNSKPCFCLAVFCPPTSGNLWTTHHKVRHKGTVTQRPQQLLENRHICKPAGFGKAILQESLKSLVNYCQHDMYQKGTNIFVFLSVNYTYLKNSIFSKYFGEEYFNTQTPWLGP